MPCLKTKQIIAPLKSIGLRFFLQNLHLNFKIKDEIKGILSNHLILFLHRGQKDLLDTISKFFTIGIYKHLKNYQLLHQ